MANLQEYDPAIEDFTEAIKLSRSKKEWLLSTHERAKCFQIEGRYEASMIDFDNVIRFSPTNAHAHFRRAFLFKALGQLDAAADDFEVAKMLDPDNPNLVLNYKDLRETECIVLCPAGDEPEY